jgi:hypothetical protein
MELFLALNGRPVRIEELSDADVDDREGFSHFTYALILQTKIIPYYFSRDVLKLANSHESEKAVLYCEIESVIHVGSVRLMLCIGSFQSAQIISQHELSSIIIFP